MFFVLGLAAVGGVARKTARPVEHGKLAVGIFVHANPHLDVAMAVPVGRNLQTQAPVGNAVVMADNAVLLDGQDVGEIAADVEDERRPGLGRRRAEAPVG
jgi:hypothetical protein